MINAQPGFKALVAMLLIACSASAASAEYMVQIGAHKNKTNTAIYENAASVGNVHHLLGSDSWQKVLIGKFSSRVQAEEARLELINLGYEGAFLVSYRSVEMALGSKMQTDVAVVSSSAIRPNADFDRLAPDEKAMAVYLDGQLRIKRGERFMTVDEYRKSR